MPTDTKRLPVPEESRPYVITRSDDPLINKENLRRDGRTVGAIRPVFATVGTIQQARGSCYVEVGATKVISAVYGPREVERRDRYSVNGQISCLFKFATFSQRRQRRQHQQDSEEREISQLIAEALEPAVMLDKFPRARLDLFVTVLEDAGSALSVAISCASLAIAHAGIEMFDLVTASSLKYIDGVALLNPSDEEESFQQAAQSSTSTDSCVTVAYMPSLRQISTVLVGGVTDISTNQKNIDVCIEGCLKIHSVLQNCLTETSKTKEISQAAKS